MMYNENTLSQLVYLKQEFGLNDGDFPKTILSLSPADTFITGLILGIMHGQSGQYLSVSMPNTFSMSEGYVEEYIEKEGLEPPNRNVFQKLLDRLRTIYKDGPPARRGHAFFGDARDLPSTLADAEETPDRADLVFTSPPYLKVLKYGLYNWIRLWFLNQEPDTVDQRLDDELDLEAYLEFMTDTFEVMDNVVDPDTGVAAFVIGDVDQNGETINLAREVAEEVVAPMTNFEVGRIVEDRVPDNEKVSRIWGDTKGEATEIDRILIAHRGEVTVRENPSGLKTKSLPGQQETLGSFNN
jgi:site-specific DNA-methyltransferase (adenine-specific)